MVISYCLILQLIFIYYFFVSLFFTGSGQRFFQRRLRLVTFISTHFTTSSSKPSMFFFFRAHYLCYKLSKSRWGLTWRTPKNVCVWVEGLIGRILWVAQMSPPLLMFSYRFNKAFVYPLFYRMYGLFQTTFYFGYMALFSAGLGIMCGKCYGTLMLLLTKNDEHCNRSVNWAPSKKGFTV